MLAISSVCVKPNFDLWSKNYSGCIQTQNTQNSFITWYNRGRKKIVLKWARWTVSGPYKSIGGLKTISRLVHFQKCRASLYKYLYHFMQKANPLAKSIKSKPTHRNKTQGLNRTRVRE